MIMDYILQNDTLKVIISELGASVVSVETTDAYGISHVALSPKSRDNFAHGTYAGALIGSTSGRIRDGRFVINGKEIILTQNDGKQNLHGGFNNLSRQTWRTGYLSSTAITMTVSLPDGCDGFPGNRTFAVSYSLHDKTLRMEITAVSDATTFVDCSSHIYWNLSGDFSKPATDHLLQIPADIVNFNDETHVPVSLQSVVGTPFDFRKPNIIEQAMAEPHQQLQSAYGYNNCFVLDNGIRKAESLNKAAVLSHTATNRSLQIYTDAPAIVFYSGGYLDSTLILQNDVAAVSSCALAFECGGVPNAVNREESEFLQSGERWKRIIEYRLS